MGDLSRRAFITSGAVAATGAAIAAAPKLVGEHGAPASSEPAGKVVEPTTPTPAEPVVAYIRDPNSGEITISAGLAETTYQDKALVKRLLDAAPQIGGSDVLAP